MAEGDQSQNRRAAESAQRNDGPLDAEAARPQQEPSWDQAPPQAPFGPGCESQMAQGRNGAACGGATPPQEDCRIGFEFASRGRECAASLSESESEEHTARRALVPRPRRRRRDGEPDGMQLVGGNAVIDEATGLATPVDIVFPLAREVGDGTRAVRDDFRTDWVLPPGADGEPQSTGAMAPWIADPLDDSPDVAGWSPGGGQARRAKGGKRGSARKKRAQTARRQTTAPPARPTRQAGRRAARPELQPRLEGLFKLPAELRCHIYRELLVADAPIIVHGGWRLVYRHPATRQRQQQQRQQQQQQQQRRRRGLGLCVAILRAHSLFCAEGLAVLYGENTFLYRLRDPAPTVTDVSRLAYDDHLDDQGERPGEHVDVDADDDGHDSASDWEQDRRAEQADAGRPTGPRRARANKARCDIFVDKHRHLFRSIVVEAEHNRFSDSTMRAMARAILAFGPAATPTPNIRTLVVRVAPLRDDRGHSGPGPGPGLAAADDEGQQRQRFTFVDFFAADSPVLAAIRAVACRFLRVDLMTRYMDGPAERAGCSLTVDRRPEMVARRYFASLSASLSARDSRHTWLTDRAARRERKRRARAVRRALQNLGATVRDFCRSYVRRAVGGWDPFDDVDHVF